MTREEAIRFVEINKESLKNTNAHGYRNDIEALNMAIEALKQKPCEDAISRQAVIDKLNRLIEVERLQGTDDMGYGRERVSAYECMIAEIESEFLYPSVSPARPKGHWKKDIDNSRKWDRVRFYCSECGDWQIYGKTYFCPFCGADMRNEQNLEYADNDTAYNGLQSAT